MNTRSFTLISVLAIATGIYLLADGETARSQNQVSDTGSVAATGAVTENLATATFAGGCFWCLEGPFDKLDGVVSTTSGYIGGDTENPTYRQVTSGSTGHTEAVQVVFDPEKVSYEELLEVFWVNHDPTDANGQFCDKGSQYRPGIFYHDVEQKEQAESSRGHIESIKTFDEPVVTEITLAGTFYPAEKYHQDYYLKNPYRYKFYRYGCGRDSRLQQLWGTKSG